MTEKKEMDFDDFKKEIKKEVGRIALKHLLAPITDPEKLKIMTRESVPPELRIELFRLALEDLFTKLNAGDFTAITKIIDDAQELEEEEDLEKEKERKMATMSKFIQKQFSEK